jgi:hypothetical protein
MVVHSRARNCRHIHVFDFTLSDAQPRMSDLRVRWESTKFVPEGRACRCNRRENANKKAKLFHDKMIKISGEIVPIANDAQSTLLLPQSFCHQIILPFFSLAALIL